MQRKESKPRFLTTWAATRGDGPTCLVLLFASLFPAPFASQRFFYALLLAWLEVVGVSLDLLDDVFLLYFALETPQGILKRLTFLQSYFRQIRYTPKLVPIGPLQTYFKIFVASQEKFQIAIFFPCTICCHVPNPRHVIRT